MTTITKADMQKMILGVQKLCRVHFLERFELADAVTESKRRAVAVFEEYKLEGDKKVRKRSKKDIHADIQRERARRAEAASKQPTVTTLECRTAIDEAKSALGKVFNVADDPVPHRIGSALFRLRSGLYQSVDGSIMDACDELLRCEREMRIVHHAPEDATTPPMKLATIAELLKPAYHFRGAIPFARVEKAVRELGGEIVGTKGKYKVKYAGITIPRYRQAFANAE